ncbi:MAG: DNA polymerase III subunit [Candidatus Omnitrophica bacterium]|nr:DNA polymerase III subunit [Candidatus Omnitrophota bacterium]MDD5512198.1 DNA polymerase III subunit [Candidatus Omnitrophota bacterium]
MSFSAIRGQGHAVNLLKSCMESGNLACSYLFTGPEATGKAVAARVFAKALNCLAEPRESELDSCDQCPSCLKIDKGQHPDVRVIESVEAQEFSDSGTIKIEDIRQLQKEIILKPYEGRKKVFIINNAHNLTAEGQNALLKVLEEPPKNSLIILVSSRPGLLFKTIISRCRIVKFSVMPRQELAGILHSDYGIDRGYAHFLAWFCEGRLGAALAIKDGDIFREKNRIIDGFIDKNKPLPQEAGEKDALRLYLRILSTWLRDIYLVKSGLDPVELIHADRKELVIQSGQRYTFSELDEALELCSNSILYLEQNVNLKLLSSCIKGFMKG